MYLVYTELDSQCIHNVILGICENMNEVIEIIWNFSRFVLHTTEKTYEENHNIIKISKITKDQYNIFSNLYKIYEDKLLEYMERFKEWKNESCNTIFWYGVYDSEKKKDCKIIKDIIKNTSLII
jgi:hypothetical protein